jgi:hypothetical protein
MKHQGAKVDLSFRKFARLALEQTDLCLEMAQGRSGQTLELPINQAIANLLSIIRGSWFRARALDWLMFDGMVIALQGRKKLCQLVNDALEGKLAGGLIKMPQQARPQNASNPFDDIASMMRAEARDPLAELGEDPCDDPRDPACKKIRECDLFSPEGRQRRPELQTIKLNGMTIDEYYDKYFEPKKMMVDYKPGRKAEIDLVKARHYLMAHKMDSFKYGGVDGYIQYVEKGTWQSPAHHYGNFSNNDQFGPDLRLDDIGKDDNHKPLQAITLEPDTLRPVLHTRAGPYVKDERRSANRINQMTADFTNITNKIKTNKDISDIPPDLYKSIKGILDYKDLIRQEELTLANDKWGKASQHRILFGKDTNRGEVYFNFLMAPDFDINTYMHTVRIGIANGLENRSPGMFKDLPAIGTLWDGQGERPQATENTGVYWYTSSDKISIILPIAVQNAMFELMTREMNTGRVYVAFRLDQVYSKVKGIVSDPQVSHDFKIYSSALFNSGLKADKRLSGAFKRVFYTAPNAKQGNFVREVENAEKLVVAPHRPQDDPVLQELWDKGYRWWLRDSSESKQLHAPNWLKYEDGILKLGTHQYVVKYYPDKNWIPADRDARFYKKDEANAGWPRKELLDQKSGVPFGIYKLLVPLGKDGGPLRPADFGRLGTAMLGGGSVHTGGDSHGHVEGNPAGPKTFNKLLQKLMNGELGEEKPASKIEDLSCIKAAIGNAWKWWDRVCERNKKIQKHFFSNAEKEYDMLRWATQGLQLFSGHQAFQVGYISPEEIEETLKWSLEKEIRLGHAKGWGIRAMLQDAGLYTDKVYPLIVQGVRNAFNGGIVDFSMLEKEFPQLAKTLIPILGKNAFKARVREISKYVVMKMSREECKARTGSTKEADRMFSTMGGGGENEADFDVGGAGGQKVVRREGDWSDADVYGQAQDTKLRKAYNLPEPEVDADSIEPNSVTATFDTSKKLQEPKIIKADRYQTAVQQPTQTTRNFNFDDEAPQPQPQQPQPQRPAQPVQRQRKQPTQTTRNFNFDDEAPQPQPQPQRPVQQPQKPQRNFNFEEAVIWRKGLKGYYDWISEFNIYDPSVSVRDGSGFNWWGAVGRTGGTSISGEADTAKSDPTGKKGKRGRKRSK